MFNNTALDVFIGLVFIFLLYSLLATIIQEMIATRLAFRAKVLEKAILRMLEDGKTSTPSPYGDRISGFFHLIGLKSLLKGKTVAPWFYAHPLIKYLGEDNYYSKPTYLDASNFSKVMIDLLKGFNRPESQAIQSIHNSIIAGTINKLPINISTEASNKSNPAIKVLMKQNPDLPRPEELANQTVQINLNTALFLRSLWQDSGADLTVFKTKLEEWFDDTMERATGWYKRYTRILLFIIGLIIAYVFNVDTIAIHRILSTNKTAREQMVQMAISEKNNLEPNKLLSDDNKKSDSLLNATYKMVANDANQANDILGLGTSWKDSCEICKTLNGCNGNMNIAKDRLDSLKRERTIIDSFKFIVTHNNKDLDSIKQIIQKDTSKKTKYTTSITYLLTTNKIVTDSLSKHSEDSLNEKITQLNTLITRCPLIQNRKWFQFSSNQAGGVETILGWLLTALAITLGAPFWFDLLSKLISLRGSGTKLTSTSDDSTKTTSASGSANPVTVNVNSNSGEEAVG